MAPRAVKVGCVVVAVAFAGCGGSGHKSNSALPAGTPAGLRAIHGPVLVAGELPGFVPQGHLQLATSPQSWVAEYPPFQRASEAARLKALGFIAGVTEKLAASKGGSGEAVSLVEQFGSPHGANGEVASQLAQAVHRGESGFPVASIPGARGFGSTVGSTENMNIAFPVGSYYYLVGASLPATTGAARSQLMAAAQSLYRRVHG